MTNLKPKVVVLTLLSNVIRMIELIAWVPNLKLDFLKKEITFNLMWIVHKSNEEQLKNKDQPKPINAKPPKTYCLNLIQKTRVLVQQIM